MVGELGVPTKVHPEHESMERVKLPNASAFFFFIFAQSKISSYKSFDEMEADVRQMVANAHHYNLEGSLVYTDASRLLVCPPS